MHLNRILSPMKTLNVRGRLIALDKPRVMGIINVTPDSFYAGSRVNADSLLAHVERMQREGADFIDVGGYSSRPGADDIPLDEELRRVIPVVKAVIQVFPDIMLGVDTFRSEVARQSLMEGVCLINDI